MGDTYNMTEMNILDWAVGNAISVSSLKAGDSIMVNNIIYYIKSTRDNKNKTSTFFTLEDVYKNYKQLHVKISNDEYLRKLYMPSIDIMDKETEKAYDDVCKSAQKKFNSLIKHKLTTITNLRLDILENFDKYAKMMNKHYDNIKYTDFVMPFREINKVQDIQTEIIV
jgi:hypothetical protein